MTDECRGCARHSVEPDGLLTARWTWEPEAKFVREARRQAEATLGSWGVTGEALEDVILILSELVSNALVHGKGAITVTLAFDRHCGTLTGGVTDSGPDWPREQVDEAEDARAEDPFAEHGRGLQLVGLLCTRWGVTREPDGVRKTVWFCRQVG